jgi:hypothetical protein
MTSASCEFWHGQGRLCIRRRYQAPRLAAGLEELDSKLAEVRGRNPAIGMAIEGGYKETEQLLRKAGATE